MLSSFTKNNTALFKQKRSLLFAHYIRTRFKHNLHYLMDTFDPEDINTIILINIENVEREFNRLNITITSVRFLRHKVAIYGKKANGTNVGCTIRFDIPNSPPSARYHNLPWFERLQARPLINRTPDITLTFIDCKHSQALQN